MVNLNLLQYEGLDTTHLERRAVIDRARSNGSLIRGSAAHIPLATASAELVVAWCFPVMNEVTYDGEPLEAVFSEAFRILERESDSRLMAYVGFVNVTLGTTAMIGKKL
jgi:hypothetical protein